MQRWTSPRSMSVHAGHRVGHRVAGGARHRGAAVAAALGLLVPVGVLAVVPSALAAAGALAVAGDLAVAGVATASASQEDVDGAFPAANAIDGDPATRWASGNGPDADTEFTAWLQVDLGAAVAVGRVNLSWEAAFASAYEVQVATGDPANPASWTTVDTETAGDGGTDDLALGAAADARYVRVAMLERTPVSQPSGPHWYGYSLFALEVYAAPQQPTAPGPAQVVDSFESGVPAGYAAWGKRGAVTPVLSTVALDRPGAPAGNGVLRAVVASAIASGDWFGFAHDLTAPADWSAHDGFGFWFHGTGSGGRLRYELKSGGQLFERTVVDDAAGWRLVTAPFAELRLKGNPASDARFDPSATTGFAVTLTDLGAGGWEFDDVALYQRVTTLQDFEGDVPLAPAGSKVGIYAWRSTGAQVTLAVTARDRTGAPAGNHVLSGDYLIPATGYGGISHNLATAQDWSSFRGIRFLWYASQDIRPASPTAGADITVEVKDGGSDGQHAELWTTTFKDSWSTAGSRWKVVEVPFTALGLGAKQPSDAATKNGTLDLTSSWGYSLTMPAGTGAAVAYAIDDVQLYGTPASAPPAEVTPAWGVYPVDPGQTAQVGVRLTTADGGPTTGPVTVTYADGAGTATAGTHYAPFAGTLRYPAGTASGTDQVIAVHTLDPGVTSDSRSVEVTLAAQGAKVAASPRVVLNATGAAYLDAALPTAARVTDLLARMTQAEKVGQMTQAEQSGLRTPQDVSRLALGSVLSGGGSDPADTTPSGWADMVDGFQREALSTRLQIPLIYGIDAVHGHNNVVGATIMPHNTGLGAARDPALVEAAGRVTALEVRATGIPWTFAPCLCVTRDERWGRSYESFGEDPALVTALAGAAVVGLQGADPADLSGPAKVLTTAKHWVGDGGTRYEPALAGAGYPIDQGVTHVASLAELRRLYVAPYERAIAAGVGSMMPSYSAVDIDGAGPVRMHENGALNNGLLKGELGFDGFLVSDWEGIDKLSGGTYPDKVARSVDAGLDMAMAPFNYPAFITALTGKVADGTVAQSRVDDAVRRILTQKLALGLFETPLADRTHTGELGSTEHRAVAREAAAESQVLLKNDAGLLPLAKDARIYVAGSNADDLGHQTGGWTVSWQGGSGDTTTGTSILAGIRQVAPGAAVTYSRDASAPTGTADVGVVVVGEPPYAEGVGDVGNNGRSLDLPAADRTAIDRVCAAMPCVVLVVAGRPQLVTDRLGAIDALVASWLPGSEGAGVADTLFGEVPFTGRLPVTWPASAPQVPVNVGDATYEPLYAYGWGLRTDAPRARLDQVVGALADGAARTAVQAVLDADVWSGDAIGPGADPRAGALRLLAAAASLLEGPGDEAFVRAGLVVSVARDLAQTAVVAGGPGLPERTSSLTADAEHALMSGRAGESVVLLGQVLGVDLSGASTSTATLSLSPSRAAFGGPSAVTVRVTTSAGAPSGAVQVQADGVTVAGGELVVAPGSVSGTASVVLPADLPVGRHQLVALYDGSAPVAGSTSEPVRYTVVRAVPSVRTDGTVWSVGLQDPKVVEIQVQGVAGRVPTGTVDVDVNGARMASATLDATGTAGLTLPVGTGTSLIVVTYRGDATYTAVVAPARVLWAR